MNVAVLPVSEAVEKAESGAEVLRVFIADQAAHVVFAPTAFEEPKVWGFLLADVVRHMVRGLSQSSGRDQQEIADEVLNQFSAALQGEAPAQRGQIVPEDGALN